MAGGRQRKGCTLYRYLEKGLLQEWLGGRDGGRREAGKGMCRYLEKGSQQEWLGGLIGGRRGGMEWLYRCTGTC